jgi:hypothetical protein
MTWRHYSCVPWLLRARQTCAWHVNASHSRRLQGCKNWGRVDRKKGEIETLSRQHHAAPSSTTHPNQVCRLHRPVEPQNKLLVSHQRKFPRQFKHRCYRKLRPGTKSEAAQFWSGRLEFHQKKWSVRIKKKNEAAASKQLKIQFWIPLMLNRFLC